MTNLNAGQIAELLLEIGQRSALEPNGNPYRARAYAKAAQSLRASTYPIGDLIERGELRNLPGIGNAIAERIIDLHRTGQDDRLNRMRKNVPAGVLDLLGVPGLRPERIMRLHQELGIRSLDDLARACREGRLASTRGFGLDLQRKIIQSLDMLRAGRGKLHMHRAAELLDRAIAELREHRPDLERIEVAGDLRRSCEVVTDLRLVATAHAIETSIEEHLGAVVLHTVAPASWGAAMVIATGSAEHVARLEQRAASKGLALTLDGLCRGAKVLPTSDERQVYKYLGLPFVEPELRDLEPEASQARQRKRTVLIRQKDIRGILHVHTDRSDGRNTLVEMVEATRTAGYQYIGISDHSQSAHYAGDLSVAEIAEQHDEIDTLNKKYGRRFRILKGIESDIRPDGSLDYDDATLSRFDFVIASIHGNFRLDRQAQTQRLIRAISHPATTILGHPTGRQLLRRPGYDVDLDAVLKACARYGVAVEINCNPYRLELDWRLHQRALELGCLLSINPDAHSIAELALVRWGVAMARKGVVLKEKVLTCLTREAVMAHLSKRASRRTRLRR